MRSTPTLGTLRWIFHETKYIMALDQGTTSSRAVIFDHRGRIVSIAGREFRQIYPRPGWVEHDPLEIWDSQMEAAAEGPGFREPFARGYRRRRDHQPEGDHRPLGPGERPAGAQRHRLAMPPDGPGMFPDPEDEIRRKDPEENGPGGGRLFFRDQGAVDSGTREGPSAGRRRGGTSLSGRWTAGCVYNFRGKKLHVTDYSNASRTMLFNIHDLSWDREILSFFQIPEEILPEVKPSSGVLRDDFPGGVLRRRRSPSRESSATSRGRSSAKPVSAPGSRRTPTGRDAFSS